MSFKKVLVAIDFSPTAHEALRVASELAAESGSSLTLAHVWQPPMMAFAADAPIPGDMIDGLITQAEGLLEKWRVEAETMGSRNVTTTFLTGAPWDQLVNALRADPSYDLVVVGTHGRTGLSHVLLGSVAERVVRHAPCAVLVVRPRG